MIIKILGALFTLFGCGGVGFLLSKNYRREERAAEELLHCLQWMICQLHYRMSSLPALCRDASKLGHGPVFQVWSQFASELEQQVSPDVTVCMDAAIATVPALPDTVGGLLRAMSTSLGCFDLQGQIQSLEEAVTTCRNKLEQLRGRREVQIRNYQTLGLCTGAALVILFF